MLASGLDQPTAVAWTPDGRMLVTEKAGRLRLVNARGALAPAPLLDLRKEVNAHADRGLLGVAVDPAFASNGYVYVVHTQEHAPADFAGPKTSRLLRLTLSGDAVVARKTVLGSVAGRAARAPDNAVDCIPSEGRRTRSAPSARPPTAPCGSARATPRASRRWTAWRCAPPTSAAWRARSCTSTARVAACPGTRSARPTRTSPTCARRWSRRASATRSASSLRDGGRSWATWAGACGGDRRPAARPVLRLALLRGLDAHAAVPRPARVPPALRRGGHAAGRGHADLRVRPPGTASAARSRPGRSTGATPGRPPTGARGSWPTTASAGSATTRSTPRAAGRATSSPSRPATAASTSRSARPATSCGSTSRAGRSARSPTRPTTPRRSPSRRPRRRAGRRRCGSPSRRSAAATPTGTR